MTGDVLAEMAAVLGVAAVTPEEQRLLLDATRDVAHSSERRYAPLSAFLLGVAVAGAQDRPAALDSGVSALRAVLQPPAADPPAG